MKINDLTPSEVTVLCADRFADTQFTGDSSSEKPLTGGKAVRSERAALAAIRAAILVNAALGSIKLTWRSAEELKGQLEHLSGAGGAGGKIFGALSRLSFVQSALDKPMPHLERGQAKLTWPAGTLEALLADLGDQQHMGVFEQLEARLKARSGPEVLSKVKAALLARGSLEQFPRGFGMLRPGLKLPEATRQQLERQLPQIEAMLNAAKRQDPTMGDGLDEIITRALRSND